MSTCFHPRSCPIFRFLFRYKDRFSIFRNHLHPNGLSMVKHSLRHSWTVDITGDSLAQAADSDEEKYFLILANPPFVVSLDYETTKDLLQTVKTKKTELLFLAPSVKVRTERNSSTAKPSCTGGCTRGRQFDAIGALFATHSVTWISRSRVDAQHLGHEGVTNDQTPWIRTTPVFWVQCSS